MAVEKSLFGSMLERNQSDGPPEPSRSLDGDGRTFDGLYARVAGFVLSRIDALLDRRAEARAVRLRPQPVASTQPSGRRRVKRATRA
jgi:hypothetical protein